MKVVSSELRYRSKQRNQKQPEDSGQSGQQFWVGQILLGSGGKESVADTTGSTTTYYSHIDASHNTMDNNIKAACWSIRNTLTTLQDGDTSSLVATCWREQCQGWWIYEVGAPNEIYGERTPYYARLVEEIENELDLSPCTPNQWITVVGTRLGKGAGSWFRTEKALIHKGQRDDWTDQHEFSKKITATFSPIMEEDQARKQLKELTQIRNVQNYVHCIQDLILHIPSMSQTDMFAAFMDGLKPNIQQQIAPHVTAMAEAQTMVAKVDLHSG